MDKKGLGIREALKEKWRMYQELRAEHEDADIRKALFREFFDAVVLGSDALRRRHLNELAFRQDMDRRWRK